MNDPFNKLYKRHIVPRIAAFYGGAVGYLPPADANPTDDDQVVLEYVIVGDITTEIQTKNEFAKDLVNVRYVQLVTDPDVENYSGLEYPAIYGRIIIDGEHWTIDQKPATDSDGFTKCKLIRKLRHEFGNTKARR